MERSTENITERRLEMGYSAISIANAFIDIAGQQGRTITNLALQKLVYIAHGWYYALTDRPLINEDFQAWKYGPVVYSLYYALKKYGSGHVTDKVETAFCVPEGSDDYNFLRAVYKKYGDYTAVQLIALTHKPGSPWEKAGAGKYLYAVIDQNEIKNYFKHLMTAGKSDNGTAATT